MTCGLAIITMTCNRCTADNAFASLLAADPPGHCRQRVSPEASHPGVRRREWKLEVRKRRKAYYDRGHPFGKPAALTMYDLAQQLHMDCRHYLWCVPNC
jgi:hypothetical protein